MVLYTRPPKAEDFFMVRILWGLLLLPYQIFRLLVPAKKPGRPGSHPLSKILRQTFEAKKAKRLVGAAILIGLTLTGSLSKLAVANELSPDGTLIASPEPVIITQKTLALPLNGVLAQGFNGLHRGIDILAPYDTPIRPIADGQVVEVNFGRLGWGNTVVIAHNYGLQSRYAHLNEIKVIVGDKINQGQALGTVGLTGWTTGSHLHLEVYQLGRVIDPLTILPEFAPIQGLALAD